MMSSYSTQYWIYAILAKTFGQRVRLERDSLHSRYWVNRHCFRATGVPFNDVHAAVTASMGEDWVVDSIQSTHIYSKIVGNKNITILMTPRSEHAGGIKYTDITVLSRAVQ